VVDGIEDAQGAQGVDVAGVLGNLEADLDVALGAQVVDLAGADLVDQPGEAGRVGEVAVVQDQPEVRLVGVLVEMVDAPRVDARARPGRSRPAP